MRRKLELLLLLPLVAALACLPGDAVPEAAGGPAPVAVATVRKARIDETLVSRASVEPERQVAVLPEAGGVIREIPKGEGEAVKAGEVILVVARENYSGGVEQARAGLESARAAAQAASSRLDAATTQYERMKALRKDRAVTQAQLEEAEAAFRGAKAGADAAQAQVQAGEAGLRAAERRLGDTIVRAPFDGFVVRQNLHAGDLVGPGSPVPALVLVDIDPVHVFGSVGELELSRVALGQEAEVRLDAYPGEVLRAPLDRVNPLVEPITRRARVRVSLPNPDLRLKPGMMGELRVHVGTREAILAPLAALGSRAGDAATVWVVDDANKARARDVVVGARRGADVEVREGLEPGDTVVTWGRGRLKEGAVVVERAPIGDGGRGT